jgi:hypothetical protein
VRVRVSEGPFNAKTKRKRDDALFVVYAMKGCVRENENAPFSGLAFEWIPCYP